MSFPFYEILTKWKIVFYGKARKCKKSKWKPMHKQPIYATHGFVTREGNGRGKTNAYIAGGENGKDGNPLDVGMDIFERGLCLPSDNKMTPEQQDIIIKMIRECFE